MVTPPIPEHLNLLVGSGVFPGHQLDGGHTIAAAYDPMRYVLPILTAIERRAPARTTRVLAIRSPAHMDAPYRATARTVSYTGGAPWSGSLGHSSIGHVANAHVSIGHEILYTIQLDTVHLRTVQLYTVQLHTVQLHIERSAPLNCRPFSCTQKDAHRSVVHRSVAHRSVVHRSVVYRLDMKRCILFIKIYFNYVLRFLVM